MSRQFWETAAEDYYDQSRHPRTALLRQTSVAMLGSWFRRHPVRWDATTLEVGSGRPLAPLFTAGPVVALDWSQGMMSPCDRSGRVAYLLGDAERIGIRPGAVDAIVASLGSPFNTGSFWRETRRVARPGAVVAFTAPSYEWAMRDRAVSAEESAATSRATWSGARGHDELFTSVVMPDDEQIALAGSAGLRTLSVVTERQGIGSGAEVSLFVFEAR